jgi:threonine dehydratase
MTALRALVAQIQKEAGAYFLHPYDDEAMITGHGSLGLEILDEVPDADVIVVGVGGGGLISGVAVSATAQRNGVRIIGVEPEGAAAMRMALDAGKPVPLETVKTIADGLAAPVAGTLGLDIVRRLVEDVVVIPDTVIADGLRFLFERAKLVTEPAGAAATAALLAGRVTVRKGEKVVAIVSGGNVDRARFAELVAQTA